MPSCLVTSTHRPPAHICPNPSYCCGPSCRCPPLSQTEQRPAPLPCPPHNHPHRQLANLLTSLPPKTMHLLFDSPKSAVSMGGGIPLQGHVTMSADACLSQFRGAAGIPSTRQCPGCPDDKGLWSLKLQQGREAELTQPSLLQPPAPTVPHYSHLMLACQHVHPPGLPLSGHHRPPS